MWRLFKTIFLSCKRKDDWRLLKQNDPFKEELKKFLISKPKSDTFYKTMFKSPVTIEFYWQGKSEYSTFVINKYISKTMGVRYIYCSGKYSFCDLCNSDFHTEQHLYDIFYKLQICENLNQVNIHIYDEKFTNKDLVNSFNKFIGSSTE